MHKYAHHGTDSNGPLNEASAALKEARTLLQNAGIPLDQNVQLTEAGNRLRLLEEEKKKKEKEAEEAL
jgi:hypothetical protein